MDSAQNRFKMAREERGFSAVQLAERLQVHPSSVANWEAGRRQITIDKLIAMSELLGFSVDYLLGLDCPPDYQTETVSRASLPVLHGQPVWTPEHGWMLVNITQNAFAAKDLKLIPFEEVQGNIYKIPPAFAMSLRGAGAPLEPDEVRARERVWVEPITPDTQLGDELRGWYRIINRRLAENEYSNRFYLDAYGAKWLAFTDCIAGDGGQDD